MRLLLGLVSGLLIGAAFTGFASAPLDGLVSENRSYGDVEAEDLRLQWLEDDAGNESVAMSARVIGVDAQGNKVPDTHTFFDVRVPVSGAPEYNVIGHAPDNGRTVSCSATRSQLLTRITAIRGQLEALAEDCL